jgi:hypothetical protein
MGPEGDPGSCSQTFHKVVDRRIRPRTAKRRRPQIDEHVVRIQRPVLPVEVVGIQAHQFRAGRNCSRSRFGAGTVVVMTWPDSHRLLGDGEVFVAQAERLADPNAGVEHQGQKAIGPADVRMHRESIEPVGR